MTENEQLFECLAPIWLTATLLIGVPSLLILAFYIFPCIDKLPDPLPFWGLLVTLFAVLLPMELFIISFAGLLECWYLYRHLDIRGFGRWTLHENGITQSYGTEPERTILFSDIRNVRLNKHKSQIFLDTNDEPMVITRAYFNNDLKSPFLPFLNGLIERLDSSLSPEGREDLLSELRELQDKLRKKEKSAVEARQISNFEMLAMIGIPTVCILVVISIDFIFLHQESVSPIYRLYILLILGLLVLASLPLGLKLGRMVRKNRDAQVGEKSRRHF